MVSIKAFLESLESSNFVRTIMKSLIANQQDLRFIYFLLKSGRQQDRQHITEVFLHCFLSCVSFDQEP